MVHVLCGVCVCIICVFSCAWLPVATLFIDVCIAMMNRRSLLTHTHTRTHTHTHTVIIWPKLHGALSPGAISLIWPKLHRGFISGCHFSYLTKIAQGRYLRVPFLLFDQNCTGALSPGAISLMRVLQCAYLLNRPRSVPLYSWAPKLDLQQLCNNCTLLTCSCAHTRTVHMMHTQHSLGRAVSTCKLPNDCS